MLSTPPPLQPKRKSTTKKVILIILFSLLGLFVLCIIASQIWSKTPKGQAAGTQSALTAIAKPTGVPIIVTIADTVDISMTAQPTGTQKPTKTPMPTMQKYETPTQTNTPEFSGITFLEIKEFREGATEIQWDEYKKQLKGKRIAWSGTVNDVEKTMGSYFVWVCMDYNCLNRSYFMLEDEELAFALQKGQQISFEGYIDPGMMDFMDLFGFDVNIDYAVITSK